MLVSLEGGEFITMALTQKCGRANGNRILALVSDVACIYVHLIGKQQGSLIESRISLKTFRYNEQTAHIF